MVMPAAVSLVIAYPALAQPSFSLRGHGIISRAIAKAPAQQTGTWTPLQNPAPGSVNTMLLLSDGSVMAEATDDTAANGWYRLMPDIHGSYINGTWSTIASMHDTRLFFSSDVMPNGKVLVAGAEYGTGGPTAEVYDPLTDTWTSTPDAGQPNFDDSISDTLPNGNVLIAPVAPAVSGGTVIYNWSSNTWSTGPTLFRGGDQDEASWVKLPDGSILTVDPFGQNSERYIPSLNQWINDSNVPVALYDSSLGELGDALLMPNGKAFFLGSTGHTAIYTPSGNNNPGVWKAGADIPNGQGTPDAPAAMMSNGKIICATGPAATFDGPTSFYEYNPNTNAFTQVNGPTGQTDGGSAFNTRMLDLPDGTVLYSDGGSQLYEYKPAGSPVASGKPAISNVSQNADGSYQLSGTLLTGICEGAGYGDDAQMGTDYPIIKLSNSSGNAYFCRTYNWSDMEVMQGSKVQTTQFTVPVTAPSGTYNLQVVTNGISSNAVSFQLAQPYFQIINKYSNLAIDLIGGDTSNGAVTNLWTTTDNDDNQLWSLQLTGDSQHYKIVSKVTGKVLSVANDSSNLGTQIWDWDFIGDPNQMWNLVGSGGGWYRIKNVNTGLVLDNAGYGTANNTELDQWSDNLTNGAGQNPDNQAWRFQNTVYDHTLRAPSTLSSGRQLINGGHTLVMQTDGNLVEYNGDSSIWASNTDGHPGAYLAMQTDGNLVIYDQSGAALWSSGTNDNPGAYVTLQSDGNLVVYSSTNTSLWANGRDGQ